MRAGAGHHDDSDTSEESGWFGFIFVVGLLLGFGLFGALSFAAAKGVTACGHLISETIPHLALIREQ